MKLKPNFKRTFYKENWSSDDWRFKYNDAISNILWEMYKIREEIIDMNKVFVIGRLTGDPEIRNTNNGKSVCNFTLAIDRKMSREQKDKAESEGRPTADFIRIQTWGPLAENCNKWLSKGSQCAVVGRISTGSYEDKETGKTIYTTDYIAEDVQFLDTKSSKENKENSTDEWLEDFEEMDSNDNIPF